jgi:hypothetical protein
MDPVPYRSDVNLRSLVLESFHGFILSLYASIVNVYGSFSILRPQLFDFDFDADPVPDPAFDSESDPDPSFHADADPDPQHCCRTYRVRTIN